MLGAYLFAASGFGRSHDVDLIKHAATERGTEYETKSRLMTRQMADKVLAKLGP